MAANAVGDLYSDYLNTCSSSEIEPDPLILSSIAKVDPVDLGFMPPESVIQHVELSIRNPSTSVSEETLQSLIPAIQSCTLPLRLKFVKCGLTEGCVKTLAPAVTGCKSLHTLHVEGNAIKTEYRMEDEAALISPRPLERAQTSVRLSTSSRPTTTTPAIALPPPPQSQPLSFFLSPSATAINATTCLRHLTLRDCGLTDSFAAYFARIVETSRSLVSANLCDNGITDVGAVQVVAALRVNRRLASLSFAKNPVGDGTARALVEVLCAQTVSDVQYEAMRVKAAVFFEPSAAGGASGGGLVSQPSVADLKKAKGGAGGAAAAKKDAASAAANAWEKEVVRSAPNANQVPGNRFLRSVNLAHTEVTEAGGQAILEAVSRLRESSTTSEQQQQPSVSASIQSLPPQQPAPPKLVRVTVTGCALMTAETAEAIRRVFEPSTAADTKSPPSRSVPPSAKHTPRGGL